MRSITYDSTKDPVFTGAKAKSGIRFVPDMAGDALEAIYDIAHAPFHPIYDSYVSHEV